MIRALILDFGGTIVTMPPDAPSARELARELRVPVERVMDEVLGHSDWQLALVGAITADEFDRRLHARYGLPSNSGRPNAISRLFRDEVLSADLLALAARLRPSCRVAVLSNASTDLEDSILRDKFNILDQFDLVINSSRLGIKKPDRAIYELTLNQLEVDPHEAIFVDDMEVNVVAAARLGIHAVHFREQSQAMAEIQQCLSINGVA